MKKLKTLILTAILFNSFILVSPFTEANNSESYMKAITNATLLENSIEYSLNFPQESQGKAGYYFRRANEKLNSSDCKGAIQDFTKVIQLDPSNSYAYYGRGLCKLNTRDNKGAIPDFTKFIEIERNIVKRNRGYYWRGKAYLWVLLYGSEADKKYTSRNMLATKAFADFNKFIKFESKDIKSDYYDAYLYRGMCQHALKNYDKAKDDYNRIIQLDPNKKLACVMKYIAELEEREESSKSALNPTLATALNRVTVTLFKSCIEFNPENTEHYFWIGLMLTTSGTGDRACQYWKRAKKLGSSKASEMIQKYCD